MTVFFGSLIISAVQIAAVVVLAVLIPASEYAHYSVMMALAAAGSALLTEWIRLLIARFSGVSLLRVRALLLTKLRGWLATTVLPVLAFCVVSAIAAASSTRPGANDAALTSLAVLANMTADCLLTFARYNISVRGYLSIAAGRAVTSSAAMLTFCWFSPNAWAAIVGFAIGSLAISIPALAAVWPSNRTIANRAAPRKFILVGWSMASGSIVATVTLACVRVLLRSAMPAPVAGAVLLAFDLASRGLLVLGNAFSTWAGKLAYASGPERASEGSVADARRIANTFAVLWLSAGVAGVVASIVTSRIIHPVSLNSYGTAVGGLTMSALLAYTAKIFLMDMMLSSRRRYAAIAVSATVNVLALSIAAGLEPLRAFCLPWCALATIATSAAIARDHSIGRSMVIAVTISAASLPALSVALTLSGPELIAFMGPIGFATAVPVIVCIVFARRLVRGSQASTRLREITL